MNGGTIAVVDYGMGNLRSVAKALEHAAPEARVLVTGEAAAILAAQHAAYLELCQGPNKPDLESAVMLAAFRDATEHDDRPELAE